MRDKRGKKLIVVSHSVCIYSCPVCGMEIKHFIGQRVTHEHGDILYILEPRTWLEPQSNDA